MELREILPKRRKRRVFELASGRQMNLSRVLYSLAYRLAIDPVIG